MATATPTSIQQTLSQRAAKWRQAMSNADTGPLVIAAEISDSWEQHKAEAEGKTINEWLQRTFGDGRTLSFWNRRDDAVKALGEASRRIVWKRQSSPSWPDGRRMATTA